MEFKKKLKQRLLINLAWAVLGLLMILTWFLTSSENTYLFSMGVALVFIGLIRTIQYCHTTKDEDSIRRKEVEESDERNRMMAERARSWAFSFSIMAAGILVIVLNLLGYNKEALPFAWFVCGMVALYWVCWLIIKRKY